MNLCCDTVEIDRTLLLVRVVWLIVECGKSSRVERIGARERRVPVGGDEEWPIQCVHMAAVHVAQGGSDGQDRASPYLRVN